MYSFACFIGRFSHIAGRFARIMLTVDCGLSIIVLLQREADMNCPECKKAAKKFGKDRKGNQRFRCLSCGKTFQTPKVKTLDNSRLAEGKALAVLSHLIEGCSVRSTERLTGVHRDTILSLLTIAGRKCEALMLDRIHGLRVSDVQCDEVWSYVGMKKKTKT